MNDLSAIADRVAAYVEAWSYSEGHDRGGHDRMHRFNDHYLYESDLRTLCMLAREKVQAITVKRLNGLTPERHCPVMVRADVVNTEATLCCATDSGHGRATVYLTIGGELFELCPECGVVAVQDQVELRDGPDYIDVEVYQ